MALERSLAGLALILVIAAPFLALTGPNRPGPQPEPELAVALANPPQPAEPEQRGVYFTAPALAKLEREGRLEPFIAEMRAVGLNAIVIDIKDMSGGVTYESKVPLVKELRAVTVRLDLPRLLALFKAKGIYTIARQVAFYDPRLAEYLKSASAPWVSPADGRVVEYNLAIAQEALALGFDELQFDYIRYPDDGKLAAVYEARYTAITGFLQEARARLKGPLSLDVFGRTLWEWNRKRIDPIGQQLEELAPYVDWISPMVYPSHYEPALRAKPYETVKRALESGLKRGLGLKLRPYLQAFQMAIPAGMDYHDYIRAEIRAAEELGFKSYLFWNPRSDYSALFAALGKP
ncbi:MAG: putative glycoside hydrolase [Candidatus Bipolaricaulia bacterium]